MCDKALVLHNLEIHLNFRSLTAFENIPAQKNGDVTDVLCILLTIYSSQNNFKSIFEISRRSETQELLDKGLEKFKLFADGDDLLTIRFIAATDLFILTFFFLSTSLVTSASCRTFLAVNSFLKIILTLENNIKQCTSDDCGTKFKHVF